MSENIFLHALQTVGLSRTHELIQNLSPNDKALLGEDLGEVFPQELHNISVPLLRRSIIAAFAQLFHKDPGEELLFLGVELSCLEAIDLLSERTAVEVLTTANLSLADIKVLSECFPDTQRHEILPPGTFPISVPASKTVVALALRASDQNLLVLDDTAQMLGALRGTRFLGDLHAIVPLENNQFTAPRRGWQSIPATEFRTVSTSETSVTLHAQI